MLQSDAAGHWWNHSSRQGYIMTSKNHELSLRILWKKKKKDLNIWYLSNCSHPQQTYPKHKHRFLFLRLDWISDFLNVGWEYIKWPQISLSLLKNQGTVVWIWHHIMSQWVGWIIIQFDLIQPCNCSSTKPIFTVKLLSADHCRGAQMMTWLTGSPENQATSYWELGDLDINVRILQLHNLWLGYSSTVKKKKENHHQVKEHVIERVLDSLIV